MQTWLSYSNAAGAAAEVGNKEVEEVEHPGGRKEEEHPAGDRHNSLKAEGGWDR